MPGFQWPAPGDTPATSGTEPVDSAPEPTKAPSGSMSLPVESLPSKPTNKPSPAAPSGAPSAAPPTGTTAGLLRRLLRQRQARVGLVLTGAVVLLAYVRGADARALAGVETVDVLVVDRPVLRVGIDRATGPAAPAPVR